jgi:diamine N-acetyltransferase
MMIRLERVSRDNWEQAITLDIADDQRRFLETPSILYGIAEVQFHPTYLPHVIYDGDTMVGFVVYGYLPEDHAKWWIPLLIIDRRYQGKGYGRAAMGAVIQAVRAQAPDSTEIALNFKPDNTVAERLYSSLGFVRTAEVDDKGQITMRLKFD